MFVIQRRSDSKYWRNDKRGWYVTDDDGWVTDLQDVKPFRTMAACRSSISTNRPVYDWQRLCLEKKAPGECCYKVKYRYLGRFRNQCEHYKAAVKASRELWDSTYAIVPVELKLLG